MTFYFYDLETTSGNPRDGRIMQFAGQRTDEKLQAIGEPDDILVKLADDVLPEPDAILVHGITPQKTLESGITEAEFAKYFQEKIATANTIFVGYNNIRFDDEFMRRLCYRTFYDPYQWHWKDGKSRWDLLDPIRMMRALRPDGLKWPTIDGKPTVKLELMAKENGFLHENAHDALSDVTALIQLAQSFKQNQPKLFEYLLNARNKKVVAELVLDGKPFVYTSGRYSSDFEKTTVVTCLFKHPRRDSAVVYDLREDIEEWQNKSAEELVKHMSVPYGDDTKRLPVKVMHLNKCPAVAPLSVVEASPETIKRIKIDLKQIKSNHNIIANNKDFIERIMQALDIIENEQQTSLKLDDSVDNQIYDGFWGDNDQNELSKVVNTAVDELSKLTDIKNKRIREMVPLYIARNYPSQLTQEATVSWEAHKQKIFYGGGLNSKYARFSKRMQELSEKGLTKKQEYLLTELQLYAESILPEPNSD